MKRWYATSFLILFLLTSCGEEEVETIPQGILAKSTFISVIVDLQILESHYQREYSRPDVYRNALDSASWYIFDDYSITKEIFEQSLTYYSEEPDSLYALYEAALDTINYRLQKEQDDPSSEEEEELPQRLF